MTKNFFERRQILKKTNCLDLTPVRRYSEEINDEGLVTVIIPKFTNQFLVRTILPKLKFPVMKINLDEIGSAVWLWIDGKINVGQIADRMLEKFGDKVQPVEERLTKFITHLYEQKFITFSELN
ncbi:MAG: hypothetical protein A2V66_14490 [Ignavibacteria bacterium RBG_13_36_8]|nr:MAG: hypothetical protein A2V66_14490 [Ignavibacteria bacterium RBG_13_36_8]